MAGAGRTDPANPARFAAEQVVDGHGADVAHPPGPELRALVDELRRLGDQVVRTDAPPAVLREAAALLARAADLVEPHTPEHRVSIPAGIGPDGDPLEYFPFSPVIGRYSPLAPPLDFEVVDGGVRGRGTYGAAFEGPPGCVHGGTVAQVLDELLGVANIAAGYPAVTGTLTIRYASPTPLFTELRLEARSEHWERRKVRARGSIYAGDRLCAQAEGVFVMVDFPLFERHTRGE